VGKVNGTSLEVHAVHPLRGGDKFIVLRSGMSNPTLVQMNEAAEVNRLLVEAGGRRCSRTARARHDERTVQMVETTDDATTNPLAQRLIQCGRLISRYGLVIVLAWIGFGKYVKMEARVLIEHSPLMAWVYDIFSATTVARGLGTMEILAAVLIALHPLWPRASVAGSALGVVLFLGTLSFLFTSPGVIATHAAGLPVLSAMPGQFLLKDFVLIGVAVWTLGESLAARRPTRKGSSRSAST
jgi:uncharacterized membrane protein YkgB